jgi:hypothetical protein
MIHGLDTGFLVAAEVLEHADHVDWLGSPRQVQDGASHDIPI